ncbi:DEAD/DEAH box helicase [Roseomonas elaeocarpi]|uniref:DEAD/DEAH box helicase n=1 Tax=Roseomonas elaeocarpi TaxID=907779 RepID=A0ABV6JRW4_9PROT
MPFPSDLPASIQLALTERGYNEPTPVQAAVLDGAGAGRDLLVSAQTGSGKTVAYGLAMAADLLGAPAPLPGTEATEAAPLADRLPAAGTPLALVIAPTRELALQVKTELSWLYGRAGGRVISCVGGMDPMAERRELSRGAHIVVGTPGRLRDHVERGNLKPDTLRVVVLDEADEMLDLGFREELEAILDTLPDPHRTLLFSATVPREIAQMARSYQRDAQRIEVKNEGGGHGDIEHRAALIAPHEIERAVVNLLRLEDPRIAMVFCATRATVNRLHSNLTERGFSAVALSGELSQAERTRALQSLRDGRARVCVATDVAARGIDLPDLGLVIHAELPRDPETLTHRSGRTGRAGKKGISTLLVPYSRRRLAERLLFAAKVNATWGPAPSAETIRAKDNERLAVQALTVTEEESGDDEMAMARTLLETRTPEQVAAALIRTLRGPLPAPEELSEGNDRPRRDFGDRDGSAPGAAPRAPRPEGVWFRASVGRDGNADPRWLLPFLCRRGHVTREEIGRIRILDTETQFEVAQAAATRFASAARKAEGEDAHIAVEIMDPAAVQSFTPRPAGGPGRSGPRAGYGPRPAGTGFRPAGGDRGHGDRPQGGRYQGDRFGGDRGGYGPRRAAGGPARRPRD